MRLTWRISEDGSTLRINIGGRFDFDLYHDLHSAYTQPLPSDAKFIIDLSSAESMDSAALGMLLLLRDRVRGDKSNIKIIGSNSEIRKTFAIAKFDRLFDIR